MVNSFKIHFEKSRPIYNAGELLSGVIEFIGDSEEIVKGLKVKCSGKALVSFQLGKSRIYDREILIKQSYFIFGNDQKEVRIPRGTHNYPFQFALPLNLPSSFNGSNGSITYKIKAIMSKGSLSRDICAKTIFRVIDRNEIYSEPLMLTQKILRKERSHSCLLISQMETRNSLNPKIGGIPTKDLSRYFPGVHLDLFKFLFRAEPTIQLTRIPIISDISNAPIGPELNNISNIPNEPDLKLEISPASPEKSHSPPIPPSSNILIEEIDLNSFEIKPEPAQNIIGEQNHPEINEEITENPISKIKELITNKYPTNPIKESKIPQAKTVKESLICPICHKIDFENNGQLQSHIEYHKSSIFHEFKCDQCSKTFSSSNQLVFHKFEHKYGPDFLKDYKNGRCSICKKQSFKPTSKKNDKLKLQTLRNHILGHEGLMRQVKCPIEGCGIIVRVNRLKAHQALHKRGLKLHLCPICSKTFQYKPNLKSHMKSRHGPIKCKYRYCPLTFPNEALRVKHAQIHEDDFDSTNLCPHCGKIFTRNSYLRKHLRTHEGTEKVKCTHDGCGKVLSKEYLKDHIERMHLPEDQIRKYICEICGDVFKSDIGLYTHKTAIHLQKYACPIPDCGILNRSKMSLEKHLKSHKNKEEFQAKIKNSDGPKYPCEKCDKVYSQSQSLRYHERTFHAKTKLRCHFEGCGREFTLQRYLDDHKMTHSTERVKCKFCEKSYSKMKITSHIIKFHKKERDCPFKCSFCGDTFVREKILKMHVEKNHSN